MAILIDSETKVVVQGMTGREGRLRTETMVGYGSKIVAGVTPGKGGQTILGIPVYNTVKSARENHPEITASAIFAPPRVAKEAVFEAIDAGIKMIGLFAERIPQHDMLEIVAYKKHHDCVVIGPNSPGLISPGKCLLGMLGGTVEVAKNFFGPGPVGVLSRSGGITATICYYLMREGLGQSTAIGTGGDAFLGSTWCDLLPYFEEDDETKIVVAYGEIGTTIEENAAKSIKDHKFTKPMVIYISGLHAKKGVRFGHAGAMLTGQGGGAKEKKEALRDSGLIVADHFDDIGKIAAKIMNS